MYLQHYNLREKPFQITTDPKFLWLGEKHQEALATLQYGLLNNKGFLLLTGDVGTGKTTLIKALLNGLDQDTIVASVVDPKLEKLEFFNFLAGAFGMDGRFEKKVEFLVQFTRFLNAAYEKNKTVLLIIDEAQTLSLELLEEIRLLSNIEKDTRKLLNVFFVGQNEFNDLLMQESCRALRQRITITYHIRPLTPVETGEYVKHRLEVAGTTKQVFTPKAVQEIFTFSRGYPRIINILCDHALLTGYVREMASIPPSVIRECAQELALPGEIAPNIPRKNHNGAPRRKSLLRRPMLYAGLALLAALVVQWSNTVGVSRDRFSLRPLWNALFNQPEPSPTTGSVDRVLRFEPPPPPTPIQEAKAQTPEVPRVQESPQAPPSEQTDLQMPLPPGGQSSGPEVPEPVRSESTDATPAPPEFEEKEPLLVMEDLHLSIPFRYDTNALSDQAYGDLDRLAAALEGNLDFEVVVRGFTDSLGTRSYNEKLSEFRAHIVKSYLVGKGIDPSRIEAVGLADDQPIQPNDSSQGRAANRRVEIELRPVGAKTGP